MATITQRAARVARTISGNSPQVIYVPEGSTQSFKAGEFVALSSGKAVVCDSDATTIFGMAAIDATGTADTMIPVYPANADTIFEANVYHATPASAVTAITQVGSEFGLEVASNKHYVGIDDTSNKAFHVLNISKRHGCKVGDQYGILEFQVLDSVSQARP